MIGRLKCTPNFSPDLYVIVDHALAELQGISVGELIQQILHAGPGAVQYRAKHLPKRQYFENLRAFLPVARNLKIPLIVNDHLDIALALSADGIHLGQNDLPFHAASGLLPDNMILGVSTHSESQAADAVQVNIGYLAIGPVFPTRTKADPDPVVGTRTVKRVKEMAAKIPLIAIGGITLQNVAEVIRAGADGVAVASALVLADDPAAAVRAFKNVISRAKAERA